MITLKKLSEEWLKRFPKDWKAARRDLKKYLLEHKEILEQILDESLTISLRTAIQQTGSGPRKKYWEPVTKKKNGDEWVPPRKGDESKTGQYLSEALLNPEYNWMEYPMENGKPLGDCTKTELDEIGDKFVNEGKTYIRRGEYFKELAGRLSRHTDTPRKKMSPAMLRRIAEKRQVVLLLDDDQCAADNHRASFNQQQASI